jgi:hypothetical protein
MIKKGRLSVEEASQDLKLSKEQLLENFKKLSLNL